MAVELEIMSGNEPGQPRARRKPAKSTVIAVEAALAIAFTGYGAHGVLNDDLVIPYSLTRTGGYIVSTRYLHFHGATALLLFAGLLCVAAALVVLIIEQVNTNPGAKVDRNLANGLAGVGFAIIGAMTISKLLGVV